MWSGDVTFADINWYLLGKAAEVCPCGFSTWSSVSFPQCGAGHWDWVSCKNLTKKCVFGCHSVAHILCSVRWDTYPLFVGGIQTDVRGKSCGIGTFHPYLGNTVSSGWKCDCNSTGVESDPWLDIQTLLLLVVVCWAGHSASLNFFKRKQKWHLSGWITVNFY